MMFYSQQDHYDPESFVDSGYVYQVEQGMGMVLVPILNELDRLSKKVKELEKRIEENEQGLVRPDATT